MPVLKENALKMRLGGKSYNEISKELSIPKSTLSGWFKDIVLSDAAVERLKSRTNEGGMRGMEKNSKLQTHRARQRAKSAQQKGVLALPEMSQESLLHIGVALYWAEGYKRLQVREGKTITSHPISFVNSDPAMVRIFIRFLQQILDIQVEDIHLTMRLYAHISEEEARKYWTFATEIPNPCYKKTTYMVSSASKSKKPFNRLPYGTLQISVNNTQKFHYLLGLIEGMKENIEYDKVFRMLG